MGLEGASVTGVFWSSLPATSEPCSVSSALPGAEFCSYDWLALSASTELASCEGFSASPPTLVDPDCCEAEDEAGATVGSDVEYSMLPSPLDCW